MPKINFENVTVISVFLVEGNTYIYNDRFINTYLAMLLFDTYFTYGFVETLIDIL